MFKIKRGSSSVEAAFRSVALSQIHLALSDVDSGAEAETAVHAARRRCKKLRGLLRLVRPAFRDYGKENATIRGLASSLSAARDAEALVESFDAYIAEDATADGPFSEVRQRLVERGADFSAGHGADLLAAFGEAMVEMRTRAVGWDLSKDGFGAVKRGLGKTYGDARRRMHVAEKGGEPTSFHDWRKAVKYHGHHVSLLRNLAPDFLVAQGNLADRLAEILGDHHNLAVLRETIADTPDGFGPTADIAALDAALGGQMKTLEETAFGLGRELLAEKPAALVARFERYWKD